MMVSLKSRSNALVTVARTMPLVETPKRTRFSMPRAERQVEVVLGEHADALFIDNQVVRLNNRAMKFRRWASFDKEIILLCL